MADQVQLKVEAPRIEVVPSGGIESTTERASESVAVEQELRLEPLAEVVPAVAAHTATPTRAVRMVSPLHRQIERVLEEDLIPLYRELDVEQRRAFRTAGEQAAGKIEILLQQATVKIRDIIKILISWLSLLPGVNRFFVEQEAKLKADKILFLKSITPL